MSILKGIKKIGKKIGKVATKAAPFAGLIPGVGTLAAAGIGAAGGLLSGKGGKVDPYSPYDSGADQFIPNIAGGGGGTDWGKIIGMAGKVAPLAIGAAGAFQNAKDATQNRQLTQEQIQQARDAIARQKMLQDQALAGMNQPVAAPDYSSIFGQSQNPFYRPAAQAGG